MESIKKTIAAYFLPNKYYLKGRNYLFVTGDSTTAANAKELKGILDLAKKINPNNVVRSSTNQMTIIVGPGSYSFGVTKLVLDTPFINIVSLTGNCDVLIDGLTITAGNMNLKGIDCGVNAFTISNGLTGVVRENCKGLDYTSDSLDSLKVSVSTQTDIINANHTNFLNQFCTYNSALVLDPNGNIITTLKY